VTDSRKTAARSSLLGWAVGPLSEPTTRACVVTLLISAGSGRMQGRQRNCGVSGQIRNQRDGALERDETKLNHALGLDVDTKHVDRGLEV
jgi:hypothetical protein